MRCIGFEPFVNPDSKILILGSFPSVKSRETDFYYGNKQNRFWRLIAEICNTPVPQTNDEKKKFLTENKIALWDIVIECDITGSMDSAIKNPVIADVKKLLTLAPIEKIFTNGQKSHALLLKNFPDLADITINLPSTSPANGRFDKNIWKINVTAAIG